MITDMGEIIILPSEMAAEIRNNDKLDLGRVMEAVIT